MTVLLCLLSERNKKAEYETENERRMIENSIKAQTKLDKNKYDKIK